MYVNEMGFQAINRWAGVWSGLDRLMILLAQDAIWIPLIAIALLWIFGREKGKRAAFDACLTAAAALVIAVAIVSPIAHHPRPFVGHAVHQLIPHAADSSFPSDHATLAFSLAFGVWPASRRLGAALSALALLIGVARVFVGVHYPGDILGAIALAVLVRLAVHLLRARLEPLARFCMRVYGRLVSSLPLLSRN
jgi:undecaprenyl-diphosphatase